jgi:hypothetical protein
MKRPLIWLSVVGFVLGMTCLLYAQGFAPNTGYATGNGNPLTNYQIQNNGVNWTNANINPVTGVNWELMRVSYGNTASSTNWQAFGV